MNELQVFRNSEFGELGVLEISGKSYFPATACAKKLGYVNPQKAIRDHCKGVNEMVTPTNGGTQTMRFISEGDLYRLIVHSNLPGAERFERWVFDEVLPAIRRGGAYAPDISAIIAQTVQATIREMTQQLLPYLADKPTPPEQLPKRRRYRHASLIGRLDTELRQEIEGMLLDTRHTYCDISAYFKEQYGISISTSSIGRYAIKLFEQQEDILL